MRYGNALLIVLLVVFQGCATPVERSPKTQLDELGCKTPPPEVLSKTTVSIEAATAAIGYITGATVQSQPPEVMRIYTQEANDKVLRDYLRCRERGGKPLSEQQQAWWATFDALASKLDGAGLVKYVNENPFPDGAVSGRQPRPPELETQSRNRDIGDSAPQPTTPRTEARVAQVAEKPRPPRIGDWWEIRLSPGNPDPCSRWEYQGIKNGYHTVRCGNRITYSESDNYNYVGSTDSSGKLLDQITPYFPGVSYPLWVGKEWSARVSGFRAPNDHWVADIRVKVTALEDVEVAAGRFKAFRIELQESWRAQTGVSGQVQLTYWIAQDIFFALKGVSSDPKLDFELISFHYNP